MVYVERGRGWRKIISKEEHLWYIVGDEILMGGIKEKGDGIRVSPVHAIL